MPAIYVEINTHSTNGHAPGCPMANPCNHHESYCDNSYDSESDDDSFHRPLLAAPRQVPLIEYSSGHAPSHHSSRSRAPSVVSRGRSAHHHPPPQYAQSPSYSYAESRPVSHHGGSVRSYASSHRAPMGLIEYPGSSYAGSQHRSRPPPVQYAGSARSRALSVHSIRSRSGFPARAVSVASSSRTHRTSQMERNGRDRLTEWMANVNLNGPNYRGDQYRADDQQQRGGEARRHHEVDSDEDTVYGGVPLRGSRYGGSSRHSTVGRRSRHGGGSDVGSRRDGRTGGSRRRSFLSRFGL